MSSKSQAVESGQLTYSSGRPCRRGHLSDRYVSNNGCIACIKEDQEDRRTAVKLSRRKYINAKVNNLHERMFMVHEDNRALVQKFCEILQYADGFEVARLADIVEKIYEQSPTPRALTYDDLLTFMEWDGRSVKNLADLERTGVIEYDRAEDRMYVHHNGNRYFGLDVAAVLRREKHNVKPM
jgi:hypothetical protein